MSSSLRHGVAAVLVACLTASLLPGLTDALTMTLTWRPAASGTAQEAQVRPGEGVKFSWTGGRAQHVVRMGVEPGGEGRNEQR